LPFAARRIVTRVQAAASAGRSAFRAFFSSLIRAFAAGLACFYGDGLGDLGATRLQSGGGGVPGEGDLVLAQVPDHLARVGSACYIGSGSGAAPGAHGGSGEQQVQGRQVRKEFVLADTRCSSGGPGLVPSRWYGRAGTGTPACRWTRLNPSGARILRRPAARPEGTRIYICDTNNNRVQKWAFGAATGQTVAGGNGQGSGASQLNQPAGIALDPAGDIYVSDSRNCRVQIWEANVGVGVPVAGGQVWAPKSTS
jgi:hypothetical protein